MIAQATSEACGCGVTLQSSDRSTQSTPIPVASTSCLTCQPSYPMQPVVLMHVLQAVHSFDSNRERAISRRWKSMLNASRKKTPVKTAEANCRWQCAAAGGVATRRSQASCHLTNADTCVNGNLLFDSINSYDRRTTLPMAHRRSRAVGAGAVQKVMAKVDHTAFIRLHRFD
jgi:hypothetical protein